MNGTGPPDGGSPLVTQLLRIDLLGAVRIYSLPDHHIVDVPGSRHQLLLAHLARAPGKLHQRRQVAESIWYGRGEEQARASLRHAIWSLRTTLGDGAQALRVSAQELGLDPERLTYFFGGLDQKLVGVEGAEPIHKIMS